MGKAHQIEPAYTVSGRGCWISRVGNYRSYMPTTLDRTCLLGVRTAFHDLTGSEHNIVHAYNVSGRSCRISLVGNYSYYMPTRHQEGTSGSHGFETPDRTCLLGVRTALHDLTGSEQKIIHTYKVRHIISNLPTRYHVGVTGSHGLGTTDRTCLLGNRR